MNTQIIEQLKAEFNDAKEGANYYANTLEIRAQLKGKAEGLFFAIELLEKENN